MNFFDFFHIYFSSYLYSFLCKQIYPHLFHTIIIKENHNFHIVIHILSYCRICTFLSLFFAITYVFIVFYTIFQVFSFLNIQILSTYNHSFQNFSTFFPISSTDTMLYWLHSRGYIFLY